jgi:hypothetical protein
MMGLHLENSDAIPWASHDHLSALESMPSFKLLSTMGTGPEPKPLPTRVGAPPRMSTSRCGPLTSMSWCIKQLTSQYQIVKLYAESRLDDPLTRFGTLQALWTYVDDDKLLLQHVDAIDLLDLATQELAEDSDHAGTLGKLRVRLVQANPKDRGIAISCLRGCLLHWDLVSAQQVRY